MSPDMQQLINKMQSGNIPACKIAANKYFSLGGAANDILIQLGKGNVLNVGFIIAYFVVAGKESDQAALDAWKYLQHVFVKYPDLFEVRFEAVPKEVGQEARDILVAAQKYLLLPTRIASFGKFALETSKDRIRRRKKLLALLGAKNALETIPYDKYETLNERCLFDVKFWVETIYKIPVDYSDTLTKEEIDLASKAGMLGSYPLYKNISLLANTNDESYLCYNKWICKYFLPYAIKMDDKYSPNITRELYYSICGRDAQDERDYEWLCPAASHNENSEDHTTIFYQSPTVKLNIIIGQIWEHFCQTFCLRIHKDVITNNDPRIRLPNNAIPDIAYGASLKFECGQLVFAPTIIECKKSMYFTQEFMTKNGISTIFNNETTDKYYEYCDELQYWILEKPTESITEDVTDIKIVFAEDLLKGTALLNEEREYLNQLVSLVHLKNSKLLRYMSKEEEQGALKTRNYWDNDTPEKWISDIDKVAPLLNICLDDLVQKPKNEHSLEKTKDVIRQYDKNGVFIKEFENTGKAAQELGVSIDSICDAAAGRRNSAAGYLWRRLPLDSPIVNIDPPKIFSITNKRILQINSNGELVAEFETIAAASRAAHVDRKGIRDVICGRQKSAGGFFWEAIE